MKQSPIIRYYTKSDPASAGRRFASRYLIPALAFLVAMFGRVAFMPAQVGHFYANAAILGDGYSPASLGTQQLPQSTIIHYEKTFISNLKANLAWMRATTRMVLPENSGNQLKLFMYQTMPGNPVQQAEGTVGSGLTISVLSNVSTIGNYADFINVSQVALQTAIDPVLDSLEVEMSYRFAQTINTIVQRTADGAVAIDSSVNSHSKAYNAPMATTDITTNVQSLVGRNVQPFESGYFMGIIHPFIVGDVINDNTNNGIVDVLKRTAEGQEKLRELPSPDGDMVPVLEWGGVRWMQSTTVTQTANYQGHGVTALRSYIIGRDGVISISLGSKMGTQVGDGDWKNLKLYVKRADGSTVSDPAVVIGGWVAYNAMFTASLVPDLVQRIRVIDAVPVVS
jgi:hypothetical protein